MCLTPWTFITTQQNSLKFLPSRKNLNVHISTIFLFQENHKYWMCDVSGKQKIQSSVFTKSERSGSLKPLPDTSYLHTTNCHKHWAYKQEKHMSKLWALCWTSVSTTTAIFALKTTSEITYGIQSKIFGLSGYWYLHLPQVPSLRNFDNRSNNIDPGG